MKLLVICKDNFKREQELTLGKMYVATRIHSDQLSKGETVALLVKNDKDVEEAYWDRFSPVTEPVVLKCVSTLGLENKLTLGKLYPSPDTRGFYHINCDNNELMYLPIPSKNLVPIQMLEEGEH